MKLFLTIGLFTSIIACSTKEKTKRSGEQQATLKYIDKQLSSYEHKLDSIRKNLSDSSAIELYQNLVKILQRKRDSISAMMEK